MVKSSCHNKGLLFIVLVYTNKFLPVPQSSWMTGMTNSENSPICPFSLSLMLLKMYGGLEDEPTPKWIWLYKL